ncbi:hypothetical protein ACSU1N_03670 [Thermogladius sp. 4427co]|uniref:hypothetical protein n=1 Tax=Thermogladius sp. 4427co TaxID=3450718 RepID=UPI003F78C52E
MSSPLIRILRDEVWSSRLQPIQELKLQDLRQGLDNGLQAGLNASIEERRLFITLLEKIRNDAKRVAELRLMKTSLGVEIPSETVDKEVLSLITRIRDFLVKVYSTSIIVFDKKVLALVEKPCAANFRVGDIVFLDYSEALIQYIRGCVELVERPVFYYARKLGIEG